MYGDKITVIHNTQCHKSTLKNKNNFICYHAVCKSVAMGGSLNGHVGTNKNSADLATKILYGGKRRFHSSNLLYNIYDYL